MGFPGFNVSCVAEGPDLRAQIRLNCCWRYDRVTLVTLSHPMLVLPVKAAGIAMRRGAKCLRR